MPKTFKKAIEESFYKIAMLYCEDTWSKVRNHLHITKIGSSLEIKLDFREGMICAFRQDNSVASAIAQVLKLAEIETVKIDSQPGHRPFVGDCNGVVLTATVNDSGQTVKDLNSAFATISENIAAKDLSMALSRARQTLQDLPDPDRSMVSVLQKLGVKFPSAEA